VGLASGIGIILATFRQFSPRPHLLRYCKLRGGLARPNPDFYSRGPVSLSDDAICCQLG
jgi:hypothetical protein